MLSLFQRHELSFLARSLSLLQGKGYIAGLEFDVIDTPGLDDVDESADADNQHLQVTKRWNNASVEWRPLIHFQSYCLCSFPEMISDLFLLCFLYCHIPRHLLHRARRA